MPVISVGGTRVLLAMSPPRSELRRHGDTGGVQDVTSAARRSVAPGTRLAARRACTLSVIGQLSQTDRNIRWATPKWSAPSRGIGTSRNAAMAATPHTRLGVAKERHS